MAYHYNPNKREPNWFWRNTDPVTTMIAICVAGAAFFILLHHVIH
jgi:hypothetical protein